MPGKHSAFEEAQNALKKRDLSQLETNLLARLQTITNNGDIDLYSLIMRQLHQEEEAVDLDQLLTDLQACFKITTLAFSIRLL